MAADQVAGRRAPKLQESRSHQCDAAALPIGCHNARSPGGDVQLHDYRQLFVHQLEPLRNRAGPRQGPWTGRQSYLSRIGRRAHAAWNADAHLGSGSFAATTCGDSLAHRSTGRCAAAAHRILQAGCPHSVPRSAKGGWQQTGRRASASAAYRNETGRHSFACLRCRSGERTNLQLTVSGVTDPLGLFVAVRGQWHEARERSASYRLDVKVC